MTPDKEPITHRYESYGNELKEKDKESAELVTFEEPENQSIGEASPITLHFVEKY